MLLGVTAGLTFVGWLVVLSLTVPGALCPWCMLVSTATIVALIHATAHNLDAERDRLNMAGHLRAQRPTTNSHFAHAAVLGPTLKLFQDYLVAPATRGACPAGPTPASSQLP